MVSQENRPGSHCWECSNDTFHSCLRDLANRSNNREKSQGRDQRKHEAANAAAMRLAPSGSSSAASSECGFKIKPWGFGPKGSTRLVFHNCLNRPGGIFVKDSATHISSSESSAV